MKYLFKGKYGVLGSMIVAAGLLSGCGENPLKNMSQAQKIDVLAQADFEAQKEIKNKKRNFHDGFHDGYYFQCMTKTEDKVFCKKYYKIMVEKLKPVIGAVSVHDITDDDVVDNTFGYVPMKTYSKYQDEKDAIKRRSSVDNSETNHE